LRYQHEITAVDINSEQPRVTYRTPEGEVREATAKFLLDASGFGRVLPRLLDLEYPSDFPVRQACFATVRDNITDEKFDRNKILITTHPVQRDVWYWTIPFSNGQCSMGVVARQEFFSGYSENLDERVMQIFNEDAYLKELLKNSEIVRTAKQITGYSCNVKSLHGKGFALLGNAGEFLDPVFSSGVTIAMKSASLAAALLDRQLRGETVDWEADFAVPLKKGVKTFHTFVSAWYDGRFQDVVYHDKHNDDIKAMISSVLAGYAWDENNPYVKDSERRMNVLAEICRST
jgi:flavin-dependent dehydrogenase